MKDVSFLQHKINNAGFFLQTINVIIIAKQPVLIQLKVYHYYNKKSILRPEGDRTRPFLSSTFDLFGSISYFVLLMPAN